MSATLHVSLKPAPKRVIADAVRAPLLDSRGAAVALGFNAAEQGMVSPVVPSERTMFAPRAACVATNGSLWVADTGHHRLLGWTALPTEDNEPATVLVGQRSFGGEGRNGRGDPGPATLNVPTGIAACADGLALADAWNHRVLLWRATPRRHNQPADIVLGQENFCSVEPNRARETPASDTLFWPFGVAWDGQRLWVADTGNRRVLVWDGLPTRSGQRADLVLGQRGFSCRDENSGGAPSAASMRWPHAIAFLESRVFIADAGNNRVMGWSKTPSSDGQPCETLLGQPGTDTADHNQGDYFPGAATLNMPYALTTVADWLVVADTANSRLVAWRGADIANGAAASRLAGQDDWRAKGENRWRSPSRDSLCWPYGLGISGRHAIIADAGNNRVLLWPWSEEIVA
jgi:NHL repeat